MVRATCNDRKLYLSSFLRIAPTVHPSTFNLQMTVEVVSGDELYQKRTHSFLGGVRINFRTLLLLCDIHCDDNKGKKHLSALCNPSLR